MALLQYLSIVHAAVAQINFIFIVFCFFVTPFCFSHLKCNYPNSYHPLIFKMCSNMWSWQMWFVWKISKMFFISAYKEVNVNRPYIYTELGLNRIYKDIETGVHHLYTDSLILNCLLHLNCEESHTELVIKNLI